MNDPFVLEIRQAAAALLPPRAFLRRDRENALFITNAPRIDSGRDWQHIFAGAGFAVLEENGLMRLWPGKNWLSRLENAWPEAPDHLSRSLRRFRGQDPDGPVLELFALGARILDGDPVPDYENRLRRLAAVGLRSHSGGGLYACAILNHLIRKECTE